MNLDYCPKQPWQPKGVVMFENHTTHTKTTIVARYWMDRFYKKQEADSMPLKTISPIS